MEKESPEERLKKVQIKPVEKECLDRVFKKLGNLLCSTQISKSNTRQTKGIKR